MADDRLPGLGDLVDYPAEAHRSPQVVQLPRLLGGADVGLLLRVLLGVVLADGPDLRFGFVSRGATDQPTNIIGQCSDAVCAPVSANVGKGG